MCYFITVGVKEHAIPVLKQPFARKFHLSHSTNSSLRHFIGDEYHLFVLTDEGCSCNLYHKLGTEAEESGAESEQQKLRRKYERKGWSESKIGRAIASSLNSRTVEAFEGLRADVRAKLSEVAEQINDLALLVHWYSGSVVEEAVPVNEKRTVSLSEFKTGEISLNEDELMIVRG